MNDYDLGDMGLENISEKQLLKLETQRNRLGMYLSDAKDVTIKVTIERLISDIDFRIPTSVERINHNSIRFWDEILKKSIKSRR